MTLLKKNSLLNIDFLINKIVSSNNDKIADLGCGRFGYFVFPLAKKIGKHGKIFAVDVVKGNLESIKNSAKIENLTQIETIWSNLEVYNGTKIKNEFLDSVLLIGILHQSDKYKDILKEAIRMLKPGGKILIVEWNEENFFSDAQDVRRISKNEIKSSLEDFPIKIIEDFVAGEHHYGLLLSKE